MLLPISIIMMQYLQLMIQHFFGEDDEEDGWDGKPAATNTLIRNIISGTIHHGQTRDEEEADKKAVSGIHPGYRKEG
jgi:hypothetical protein